MILRKTVSKICLLLLTSSFFMIVAYKLVALSILNNNQSSSKNIHNLNVKTDDPVTESLYKSERSVRPRRPFHVAVTATDKIYSQWQCRIMHYWYRKMKDLNGSEMGGFTRILHSGKPDILMDEIPTFVVQPLPPGVDMGYIVLHRPWAFVQWLEKVNIEEEYILMAEPDHVFVKPLPNLSRDDIPAAYPFFYINSSIYEKIIRKYYSEDKGPITNVQPIGNSPVIINKSLLKKIAPTWMNVSMQMKHDPKADKEFGWILEMYGYAVASALHGVQHILYKHFMVQPPLDEEVGNAFIIHYTYSCDFTKKGKRLLPYGKIGEWRFNKRSYFDRPFLGNISLPPPGVHESVVTLVKKLNEAAANIPAWDDLRKGHRSGSFIKEHT